MSNDALAFLSALFAPSDLILFRPIEVWSESADQTSRAGQDNRKKSRVLHDQIRYSLAGFAESSLAHLERLAAREHANIFFGVCPRLGDRGKFDAAWQIRTVRALWADVDHTTPTAALGLCDKAGLPIPSIVVNSGNGVHLYWLLDQPLLIDDAADPPPPVLIEWTEKDGKRLPQRYFEGPGGQKVWLNGGRGAPPLSPKAQLVQNILQGIASAIGGDHTHDLARILRVPGTWNRKDGRNGRAPTLANLDYCNSSRRYSLGQFEQFAAASPAAQQRDLIAKVPLPVVKPLTATRRDKLNQLLAICAIAPAGTRSERDFDLCCYAIKAGIARHDVWTLAQGAGKFAEKGQRYFDDTWERAAEEVRGQEFRHKYAGYAGPGASATTPASPAAGASDLKPIKAEDDPHRLARLYLARYAADPAHPGAVLLRYWREEWWKWDGRRYRRLPHEECRTALVHAIEEEFDRLNLLAQEARARGEDAETRKVVQSLVSNVQGVLKALCVLSAECEENSFVDGPRCEKRNWISMANGIVDVEALQAGAEQPLLPHTPGWFSTCSLPYAFDPAAECGRWSAFLEKNLEGDGERIALLQEWGGYLLARGDTGPQKFLFLEGEGSNGKSVYCAAVEAMLGAENCSHVPLEIFGQPFMLTSTLGKLANIAADVGELDKVCEGFLKSFTAGDRMHFNRKGLSPVDATPTARVMIAANNRPRFSDKTAGVWRRMLLVPFRVEIREADKVIGMDKPEWWEASGELPGVFNWAMAGLHRLRQQGSRFTQSQVCLAALEEYRIEINPAREFLTDCVDAHADGRYSLDDIYADYSHWCKVNGYKPLGKKMFGKEIRRKFPDVQKKYLGSRGERFWVYDGIFKNPDFRGAEKHGENSQQQEFSDF